MRADRSWKGPAVVIVILLGGFLTAQIFFLNPGPEKSVINSAKDNLKLAEIKITQNEPDTARELLGFSFASLSNLKTAGKKTEEIKGKINSLLERLDLTSAKQPEIFSSFSDAGAIINKILISDSGELLAVDQNNKVFKVTGNTQSETSPFPKLINAVSAKDSALYAGNLYVLEGRAIYKYGDALTGGTSKQLWLGGLTDSDPQNIAVDGNIYVLNSNGIIVKYFKGKEDGRINLNTKISSSSKLLIGKDSPYLYAADFLNKKIRVFDKITGSLTMTYKAALLEKFTDFALDDKVLYLVSGDNKIWKIDLK